ncbi:hypothetical protein EXIGLDRAFT_766108 [Exidia glandulosa HHB12029]|uniref:Uncharacterized protein n=1 Tax=Exidia glandulosa HHB12029 TaxID=1314781 RepID=A0A165JYX1_EXIGL|nr:hypothetical protein EXIGLDRAFT_767514 [Exidia glandulosa HHB12029]KZV95544.1 hypothetical protein EXIGLDRAFT_766108 [Exidia glandulosa HHB12029]
MTRRSKSSAPPALARVLLACARVDVVYRPVNVVRAAHLVCAVKTTASACALLPRRSSSFKRVTKNMKLGDDVDLE